MTEEIKDAQEGSERTQPSRSKRRVTFGILAIILGSISLIGLPSTTYYYGLGIGWAYGAVMIALGIALIIRKETVTN